MSSGGRDMYVALIVPDAHIRLSENDRCPDITDLSASFRDSNRPSVVAAMTDFADALLIAGHIVHFIFRRPRGFAYPE